MLVQAAAVWGGQAAAERPPLLHSALCPLQAMEVQPGRRGNTHLLRGLDVRAAAAARYGDEAGLRVVAAAQDAKRERQQERYMARFAAEKQGRLEMLESRWVAARGGQARGLPPQMLCSCCNCGAQTPALMCCPASPARSLTGCSRTSCRRRRLS